jgi:Protein of unknown function (DUF4241)
METKKLQWQKVGHTSVDSGRLVILDPSYIVSEVMREGSGMTVDDLFRPTPCGGLRNERAHHDLAFVMETGYGDGVYPVYVQANDEGRIVAVKVRFD